MSSSDLRERLRQAGFGSELELTNAPSARAAYERRAATEQFALADDLSGRLSLRYALSERSDAGSTGGSFAKSAPAARGGKQAIGYLHGRHPTAGSLIAAWDPSRQHVRPSVQRSRWRAKLTPFPSRQDAENALITAGGVLSTGAQS